MRNTKMAKYKKKPVVVEAIQWTGKNLNDCREFLGNSYFDNSVLNSFNEILIETLEGKMRASVGDYLIRGIKGEHYPCKPDIFEATYEIVK